MKNNSNYYVMTPVARRRFKKWLIAHDLTVRSFAVRCGVSHTYISLVINGKSHVTPKARQIFHLGGYDII